MDTIKCYHCNNKRRMKLEAEYNQDLSEVIEDDNKQYLGSFFADKTWRIYVCPICDQITVVTSYTGDDTRLSGGEYSEFIEYIYPLKNNSIEAPNEKMPETIKKLYNEAKSVYLLSPKSAAALLRLALQQLLIELGGKHIKINSNICELLKLGLDEELQKALDVIRIIGNEAVHPGEIKLNDTPEIAYKLFSVLNYIIDRKIDIYLLYEKLPSNKKR